VPSIHRFKPEHLAALKNGRAIPFLIDHRGPECPGFTLSVIGLLDDQKFWGVYLPDDEPDAELVDFAMRAPLRLEPFPIQSDSPDAQAVNNLWSRWNAGTRQNYLEFFSLMGELLERDRLMRLLDAVPDPSDKTASTPAKKRKPKSGKSSKAKAAAKPKAKKRTKPSDKGARS
jgi:hypothetical protein